MGVRLRPLARQVVVITGASSGIGLVTARMAAARGARVVLVARNTSALDEIVLGIRATGGDAIAAPADVGFREDLERVAVLAIEAYGGVDTWVNNAGVGIWGRAEDGDERDARRLFDTNFWGVVNGSLVAARCLRGRGGALINVGSISSDRAAPLEAMYAASKHAVKGFTDAFRMELEREGAPISVTLVKPAAIGTPFVDHVKSDLEREPRLPPPLYAPEEVARAILFAATHPVRDLYVGGMARARAAMTRAAPRLEDRLDESVTADLHEWDEPALPRQDNLYLPGVDGAERGDHHGAWIRPSLTTRWRLARPRVATAAALAIAGVAAANALGVGRAAPPRPRRLLARAGRR